MADPQQPPDLYNYAVTFGHPSGQEVLKDLKYRFWYDTTTYQVGIPKLDMVFREGQRSVIVMLLQAVEEALIDPLAVPPTHYDEGQPTEGTSE